MSMIFRSKLAVMDQGALVDAEFLAHVFRFNIGELLITRNGRTVASVVKRSDQTGPDQSAAGKIVVLSYEFVLCTNPHLPLAGLVRMATEGEVALALETKLDGSEYLVLSPSTEKFDPHCEHVVILEGANQMRLGYQLYCADLAVGQTVLGGDILDYEGFMSKEIERMSA